MTLCLFKSAFVLTLFSASALICQYINCETVFSQDAAEANLFEKAPVLEIAPAVRQWQGFYRLKIDVYKCDEGIHVKKVDPKGPGARMRLLPDRQVQFALEPGDHITHVDGVQINSIDGLVVALGANGGRAVLTVKNKRTNRSSLYEIQAEEDVRTNQPNSEDYEYQPNQTSRKVVALLIGLSNDKTIGKGAESNVKMLSELLRNNLDTRVQIRTVLGLECNARNIIEEISKLDINSGDSLFCYYAGHGAYDQNHAENDPSGGHFFQIPGGDMLRRTVTSALKSKGARLTVMISDTCNVSAAVGPLFRSVMEQQAMTSEDYYPIEKLFFFNSGFLDISGSSRNQYGWYDPSGGWFTKVCYHNLATSATWSQFFLRARDRTEEYYQEKRKAILNIQGSKVGAGPMELIKRQLTQRPMVFTNAIAADSIPKTGRVYEITSPVFMEILDSEQ